MRISLVLTLCVLLGVACQKEVPSDTHTVATYAAGACWIDAGALRCWGTGTDGIVHPKPVRMDSSTTWRTIDMGPFAYCGTLMDDSVLCWGYMALPFNGGTLFYSQEPQAVGTGASWKRVVPGVFHLCGIQTDDSLWCWGLNTDGELGDGTTTNQLLEQRVGHDTWLDVAVAQEHTCAVKSDHTLWCWGKNSNGEVGDGSKTTRLLPVKVDGTDWKAVSVSYKSLFSCGLKQDGSVWCWGGGQMGALGELPESTVPVHMAPTLTFESMRVGWGTICGVTKEGAAWCWGSKFVAVSDPKNVGVIFQRSPERMNADADWEMVAPEESSMCAMKRDHSVWCWGDNVYGEVGNGSDHFEANPIHIVPEDE